MMSSHMRVHLLGGLSSGRAQQLKRMQPGRSMSLAMMPFMSCSFVLLKFRCRDPLGPDTVLLKPGRGILFEMAGMTKARPGVPKTGLSYCHELATTLTCRCDSRWS